MMRKILSWLKYQWFVHDLRFCYCHYERPIVCERSWGISFFPRPLPVFDAWTSDAAWRFMLGWIEIRVTRPGMGKHFRRKV